jgi:hypothetical protein
MFGSDTSIVPGVAHGSIAEASEKRGILKATLCLAAFVPAPEIVISMAQAGGLPIGTVRSE